MKKYLEGTRQVITENNLIINLEYYLVESTYYEKDETKVAYGVEILKRDNFNYLESDIVSKVTDSKDKIINIINKLIANIVTPVGMVCVVDELF
ncbi:DUF6514 family protein [Vallitalea guaymasensis]|uniref:Uncharacterized protein n=1 Tax=Vallitalea guaymasensis TaxID=1185412 RepID=A0A8J8M8L1_9FIRM|nr:DUF6514 family protein [Vallitalea guaymasensis]QUH28321.1 hypothetical protein HYG85_05070 [Vallitalea guaymasensis]